MTNIKTIIVLFLIAGFIACNSNVKNETDQKKETTKEAPVVKKKVNTPKKINEIWQELTLKNTPLIDSTNFDNFKKVKEFNKEEIKLLQLSKIYPALEKENNTLRVAPSYKLNLGDFNSIVINVFKGEHELESVLIIYDSNNKLSQYYNQEDKLTSNSLVIAYDEIAEGWSRKFSKIENNVITVIDELYTDKKQIDTTKFHINRNGDINQIKIKFSSTLRPSKSIILNKIYTDTIEFEKYNFDGDYPYLKGKKEGK